MPTPGLRLALAASAAVLIVPAPLLAQERPADADQPAPPHPPVADAALPASAPAAVRDDIVVTARRRSENLQTVPLAVSVIDSKTLETRGSSMQKPAGQTILQRIPPNQATRDTSGR